MANVQKKGECAENISLFSSFRKQLKPTFTLLFLNCVPPVTILTPVLCAKRQSAHASGSDMKNYQFTMLCGVAFHAEANYSPLLRLMTSDRFRATGETILIASERILHWHITHLTANAFCFRGEHQGFSGTAINLWCLGPLHKKKKWTHGTQLLKFPDIVDM